MCGAYAEANGGRLRKLRRGMKGKILKIGGKKGRLTDVVIDSRQNYYGLAIRRNTNDLEKMIKMCGLHFPQADY